MNSRQSSVCKSRPGAPPDAAPSETSTFRSDFGRTGMQRDSLPMPPFGWHRALMWHGMVPCLYPIFAHSQFRVEPEPEWRATEGKSRKGKEITKSTYENSAYAAFSRCPARAPRFKNILGQGKIQHLAARLLETGVTLLGSLPCKRANSQ